MKCAEGSKLFEINEVINIDHRSYIIDINFESYFEEEFAEWDKINKSALDLGRSTHRQKYGEYADELLDTMTIEELIYELQYQNIIKEKSETIDKDITYLMNKARRRIKDKK